MMNLQTLNMPPRDWRGRDPRQAKTDETKLMVGSDGILYKPLPKADWNRYKILTPEEEAAELARSREISSNMLKTKSRLTRKASTPSFTQSSRKTQVENKKFDKMMTQASLENSNTFKEARAGSMEATISKLSRNSGILSEDPEVTDSLLSAWVPRAEKDLSASITSSTSLSTNDIFREKYEQNLEVVNKLFNEKKAMEGHMRAMEDRLRSLENTNRASADFTAAKAAITPHTNTFDPPNLTPPTYDYSYEPEHSPSPSPSRTRPNPPNANPPNYNPPNATGGLSAAAAARLMQIPSVTEQAKANAHTPEARLRTSIDRGRTRSLSPHHNTQRNGGMKSRSLSEALSVTKSSRARDRDDERARLSSSTNVGDKTLRSSRATSRSTSRTGGGRSLSVGEYGFKHLQANADRYVMKRRAIEEREKREQVEQEEWETYLKLRSIRAVHHGKPFHQLMKSHETAAENIIEKRLKREEEEKQTLEGEKKKRRDDAAANIKRGENISRSTVDWHTRQMTEKKNREIRQEDMVARSLSQFTVSSSLQQQLDDHLKKQKEIKSGTYRPRPASASRGGRNSDIYDESPKDFRATMPPELVKKRFQKVMEKGEDEKAADRAKQDKLKKNKAEIEKRMNMRKKDDEEKLKMDAVKKAKEDKEAKEKDKERKQREIFESIERTKKYGKEHQKTVAVELKETLIKKQKEKEQADQQAMLEKKKKQELSSKQTSAVLNIFIKERERNLGLDTKTPRQREELRKEEGIEKQNGYNAQSRANQARIRKKRNESPSLINRYDTSLTRTKGKIESVGHFAAIIDQVNNSNDYGSEFDSDSDGEAKTNQGGKNRAKTNPSKGGSKKKDDLSELLYEKERIMLGKNKL